MEVRITVDVIGRKETFTSPGHSIPPLLFPSINVCPVINVVLFVEFRTFLNIPSHHRPELIRKAVGLMLIFSPKGNKSWSSWSPFGLCSVTCGGGKQKRTRICCNPVPADAVKSCPGSNISSQSCNTNKCPGKSSVL